MAHGVLLIFANECRVFAFCVVNHFAEPTVIASSPTATVTSAFDFSFHSFITSDQVSPTFYDIYILTATQSVNADTFRAALQKTEENRGTAEQMADATGAIQMIAESPIIRSLWQRYQKNYSYANDVSWDMVIGALRGLAENAKASG